MGFPPFGELPTLEITPPRGQSLGLGYCVGPDSSPYAPTIKTFIRKELTLYQAFARWAEVNPQHSRRLIELAAENFERAKLLLTAYFYITGDIYWPTSVQDVTPRKNYRREMSQLYSATQSLERSYLTAYRRSTDSCLASLFIDFADRAKKQSGQISALLR